MSSFERMRTSTVTLMLVWICLSARYTVDAIECYSCEGENCVRVSTAGLTITCDNSDDRCFTRYNTTNLLPTQRGCLKQTEESTCTGNDCVFCNTADLCNDAGSPMHRCVVCSSLIDTRCLSNPSSLTAVQCPAPSNVDLTAAQCYSRVLGNITERGCITSQGDVDGCTGLDCSSCTGSGCNQEEFPVDRIQCIKCDDETSCNADASSSVYCDDVDDVCVTMSRPNGTVMKSCKNEIAAADTAYCLANASLCNYCGKKLCNVLPFNASATTKSCYQCQGSDCLKSSARLVSCQLTDDDCYSMFSGFNPSQRGCTQELSREDKASCNSLECVVCSESECNLQSRADHRCGYCSTVNDANCIAPASGALSIVQCPAPSTDVSEAQCYTKIIGGTVTERGCISGTSDLLGCDADGRNCTTCSIENDGEACNSGLFPTDRRRCTIDTTANAYCPNPWDDCVQLLQSGTRKRTCVSSLSDEERIFCANNTNLCHFCSTDNCNGAEIDFNYVECLSCDSATDIRCATNPAALTSFEQCATCASALITGTTGNTTTRRGCLANLPSDVSGQCSATAGSSCQRCSTNRCNVANFPSDRLQCYRCVDAPCVSHQNVRLEYCPVYRSGDSCLLESDSTGQLLRLDCRSSLTESELYACSGRCQTCSTSGCNDPMAYSTSGSCVQCRSSSNGLCRSEATQVAPEPCTNPANSQCYTRLVDGVTERGCTSDLTTSEYSACTRGENCLVCNSRTDNCNTVQYPVAPLTCFQCDSRTDGENCTALQTGEAPECPTYDTANKCYTIVQSNGDTVRKCSTAARDVECGTASGCEVCLFRGCNIKVNSAVGVIEPPVRTTTPGPTNDASTNFVSCTIKIAMLLSVWLVWQH